jgi:hypothetical protein
LLVVVIGAEAELGMRDGVSQLTQASVLWIPAFRDTPECFKQVFHLYGVHGISFALTRLQGHAPGESLSSATTRGQDSPWPASLTKTDGKAYLLTPTFSLINPKNEEKVKKNIFLKKCNCSGTAGTFKWKFTREHLNKILGKVSVYYFVQIRLAE